MITYADKQFMLHDKSTFLLGGELHYFRVPKASWRDRIEKIKASGLNLISTYIPWIWHETSPGVFDFSGWSNQEKDLVSFINLCKEYDMYLLVRPGPYVMSETVNSGLPKWLLEENKEILAKKEDGSNHPASGLVSYMHPTYLQYVKRWYDQVFSILVPNEIQNDGPIIMTQYDNEVGMFHWVTSQGDYSEITLLYFQEYLLNRFGSECFHADLKPYGNFARYIKEYLERRTSSRVDFLINQAYKEFFRDYIKRYLETLISMAKALGSQVMPIVNVHGFSSVDYAKRGNRYPVGLSQLYETAKIDNVILAGDYYVGNIVSDNFFDVVIANSFTEAIQPKAQPLFSAEFQSGFQNGIPRLQPTTHDLNTRLSIACGMNAINYYMFVGGENYEEIGLISRRHDWQAPIGMDGSLRIHYHTIASIAKVISAYGDALTSAKLLVNTHMAFDPDYFMTEYHTPHTKVQADTIARERQGFIYNGIGKSLAMKNVSFAAIDMLSRDHISVVDVPSLVAFSTDWMSEFSQQKLVDYVSQGGKLFLYPRIPCKNLKDEPCTILKDFIGVDILGDYYGRVQIIEEDSINCHYAQVYDCPDGFATADLDPTKITGFEKTIGNGKVMVFGMAIRSEWDYVDDITLSVMNRIDIYPTATSADWLNIMIRKGEKGSFVFIHNFEEFPKSSVIYQGKEPICDNHVFTIPMRRGIIIPIDWIVAPRFTIRYSTAEVIDKNVTEDTISLTFSPVGLTEKVLYEGDFEPDPEPFWIQKGNAMELKSTQPVTITWRRKQ